MPTHLFLVARRLLPLGPHDSIVRRALAAIATAAKAAAPRSAGCGPHRAAGPQALAQPATTTTCATEDGLRCVLPLAGDGSVRKMLARTELGREILRAACDRHTALVVVSRPAPPPTAPVAPFDVGSTAITIADAGFSSHVAEHAGQQRHDSAVAVAVPSPFGLAHARRHAVVAPPGRAGDDEAGGAGEQDALMEISAQLALGILALPLLVGALVGLLVRLLA